MMDILHDMLAEYIDNANEFEVEMGDDGIGHYECWGSCGYDSSPYCSVTCEGTATLTFTMPADLEAAAVGDEVKVCVSGPRDADVEVVGSITALAVSEPDADNKVTVTATVNYGGEGSGSTDKNWGYEPDYDDRCEYNDDCY